MLSFGTQAFLIVAISCALILVYFLYKFYFKIFESKQNGDMDAAEVARVNAERTGTCNGADVFEGASAHLDNLTEQSPEKPAHVKASVNPVTTDNKTSEDICGKTVYSNREESTSGKTVTVSKKRFVVPGAPIPEKTRNETSEGICGKTEYSDREESTSGKTVTVSKKRFVVPGAPIPEKIHDEASEAFVDDEIPNAEVTAKKESEPEGTVKKSEKKRFNLYQ